MEESKAVRRNAPSVESEKDHYKKGRVDGLNEAIDTIRKIREYLRGSGHSSERLVNMMVFAIQEIVKDIQHHHKEIVTNKYAGNFCNE